MFNEHIINSNLKGKNSLYHATSFDSAISILKSNKIEGRTLQRFKTRTVDSKHVAGTGYKKDLYKGVSLTRSLDFKYDVFQFIFDGDLIKRDYGKSLMPHDYYNELSTEGTVGKANPLRYKDDENGADYESEEFLLGDFNNIDKYIVGIRIVDYTGDSEEEINTFKESNPEKYNELKQLISKYKVYDSEFNPMQLNESLLFEKKIVKFKDYIVIK